MNPSVQVVLRTLKASLEEHVIPELESQFARGQAGQVAVTLEWLARGLEEPLPKLREGNAEIRRALEAVDGELVRLAAADEARRDHWQQTRAALEAALESRSEDTPEAHRNERRRWFEVLDELVIAAGVPVGGSEGTGPLWARLQQALDSLARAENYLGPVPLPQHHWR